MDKTLNLIAESLNLLLKKESDVSSVAGALQGQRAPMLTRDLSLPTYDQLSTPSPADLEESSWAEAASKASESGALSGVRFVLEKSRHRQKNTEFVLNLD